MKLRKTPKNQSFHSPSLGKLSLNQVIQAVLNLMQKNPKDKFRLIIGTDSEAHGFENGREKGKADFVSAIIWHHIGHGGRYFWQRYQIDKLKTLRQRIYQEVNFSLNLAQNVLAKLQKSDKEKILANLEIHVDAGQNGPTRDMLKEVIGMVRGYGFSCYTKPESFGASCVADKHI
tara:strand:+ start:2421 stop:2945 length:525 start_codon:yes stop_codon:yes gene_type:complete